MEAAVLLPGNLVEFILTNLRSTKCASHCVRREVERQVLNFVTQTDTKNAGCYTEYNTEQNYKQSNKKDSG